MIILEWWNNGIVDGRREKAHHSIVPLFQGDLWF
jgi:hypothetical protein